VERTNSDVEWQQHRGDDHDTGGQNPACAAQSRQANKAQSDKSDYANREESKLKEQDRANQADLNGFQQRKPLTLVFHGHQPP
jgi:hypothetical protein